MEPIKTTVRSFDFGIGLVHSQSLGPAARTDRTTARIRETHIVKDDPPDASPDFDLIPQPTETEEVKTP